MSLDTYVCSNGAVILTGTDEFHLTLASGVDDARTRLLWLNAIYGEGQEATRYE